jgi:hypothetical protein
MVLMNPSNQETEEKREFVYGGEATVVCSLYKYCIFVV